MSIVRWTPFFEDTFEDMEKTFNNLTPINRGSTNFAPSVDVYEDGKNVIVETELAGIDPEKVEISIENDILTIKGESEKKSEVEEKNYYRKEIRRGSFFRTVPLPAHVVGEKASASAQDGVLKISVPKAENSSKKIIKIKTLKK